MQYKEIIYHTTTTKFGLRERIKILFGATVRVQSELYCAEEKVNVVKASARASVDRLIPMKQKGEAISLN